MEPGDKIRIQLCTWVRANRRRGGYLDVSQLLLLLPVPHSQDVIVGIVHGAEEGAAVLRGEKRTRSSS